MSLSDEIREEWRECLGGDYAVSSRGNVRRLARGPGTRRGRKIARGWDPKGYPTVSIRWKHYRIHRLMVKAFIGPFPPGTETNHKNGIKHDNRIENLEIVTSAQNRLHAIQNGLRGWGVLPGEKNGRAKLTESAVRAIRQRARREPLTRLAHAFGVSATTIGKIVRRERWKHIP